MDYFMLEWSFNHIFGSWSGLQFAVDQRCAGANTRRIVSGMASCFRTFFTQNQDLEIDEVEEHLLSWISEDLNVNIEDGSGLQVAAQMCKVFEYLSAGNTDAVQQMLLSLPAYDASLFSVDEGEDTDLHADDVIDDVIDDLAEVDLDEEEDEDENGAGSITEERMEEDESQQSERQPRFTTDEDGWTTKHKRNKRPE